MCHSRDRPELLQQAEPVPLLPFIDDLAVGEPKDADAAGPDALAGGWDGLQFALVRARARVADRHLIVLRNQVFEPDACRRRRQCTWPRSAWLRPIRAPARVGRHGPRNPAPRARRVDPTAAR